ncbi:MAG: hypothetical protein OXT67_12460 [Zetaproteobacteria bacterium]|nr:hypothetical protein [Zetaproteobacteria bacterium]
MSKHKTDTQAKDIRSHSIRYASLALKSIYLLGDASIREHLHKKLYSLSFLKFCDNTTLLTNEDPFYLVIAPVDFASETSILTCYRALYRLRMTPAFVMLFSLNEKMSHLTVDDLLFAAAMEAKFVGYGESRYLDLRAQVKIESISDTGSYQFNQLEQDLSSAIRQDNVGKVQSIFSKLHGLERVDRQNMNTLRLLASAALYLRDNSRVLNYLNRILEESFQDLWAITKSITHGDQENVQVLRHKNKYLADLWMSPDLERPRKSFYLNLMKDCRFSPLFMQYLLDVAKIHLKAEEYSCSYQLMEWATAGISPDKVLAAQAWHWMGASAHALGQEEHAKHLLQRSLEMGGNLYREAAKVLAQMKAKS